MLVAAIRPAVGFSRCCPRRCARSPRVLRSAGVLAARTSSFHPAARANTSSSRAPAAASTSTPAFRSRCPLGTGTRVSLANLSFAQLHGCWTGRCGWCRNVAAIRPDTAGHDDYFPERTLAAMARPRPPSTVYAFAASASAAAAGVPVADRAPRHRRGRARRRWHRHPHARRRGRPRHTRGGHDQPRPPPRSRPGEACRLPRLRHRRLSRRQPSHVLENLAGWTGTALTWRVLRARRARRGQALPGRRRPRPGRHTAPPSIVNGQSPPRSAATSATSLHPRGPAGSELFINPLMAMYFTVDLTGLARQNLYLDRLTTPSACARSPPHRGIPPRGPHTAAARHTALSPVVEAVTSASCGGKDGTQCRSTD